MTAWPQWGSFEIRSELGLPQASSEVHRHGLSLSQRGLWGKTCGLATRVWWATSHHRLSETLRLLWLGTASLRGSQVWTQPQGGEWGSTCALATPGRQGRSCSSSVIVRLLAPGAGSLRGSQAWTQPQPGWQMGEHLWAGNTRVVGQIKPRAAQGLKLESGGDGLETAIMYMKQEVDDAQRIAQMMAVRQFARHVIGVTCSARRTHGRGLRTEHCHLHCLSVRPLCKIPIVAWKL